MEASALKQKSTKSMSESQRSKEQPVPKFSEKRMKSVDENSIYPGKIVTSKTAENKDRPPPLPTMLRSRTDTTDKAPLVRSKSVLMQKMLKLDTKDLPRPIEPTEDFRTARPSTYWNQIYNIETSYVRKLTELENHDRMRKMRTRSVFLEKDSLDFEKIRQSIHETKEDFVCTSSEKPKAKAGISSPKKGDLKRPSISSSKKKKKKKVTMNPDAKSKPQNQISSSKMFFVRHLTEGYEKYMSDQKKMLKVTTRLGLPSPDEMPSVALPLLRKSLNKLKLREMAQLASLAQRIDSQLVRFYVEWAVDLQDDADISFFVDTTDLYGMHLRYEIANLYEVDPYVLLLHQTRGRRKSDGAVVVMTVSCAFADQAGTIVMDQDVEKMTVHIIHDKDPVPLPGEWRALIQALNVERPRLRREEKLRMKRIYEYAKKLRIRRNSISVL